MAGGAYFAVVFAVGFALGTLRVLLVVPALGERAAELAETPLMLVASYLAARWTVRRFEIPARIRPRLGVGVRALDLLLLAEGLVALWVRGVSLGAYVASRDPVAGIVYLTSLAVFALMPLVAGPGSVGRPSAGASS